MAAKRKKKEKLPEISVVLDGKVWLTDTDGGKAELDPDTVLALLSEGIRASLNKLTEQDLEELDNV